MLTFLFDQYKKRVLSEYRVRLATIYASLLVVIFLMGTALTVPTYILLMSKLSAAQIEKNAATTPADEKSKTIEDEVMSIRDKIALIEDNSAEIPIINVIEKLISKTDSSIIINSLSLKRKTDSGAITLLGVAKSRDALVSFEKRLRSEMTFSSVNLPVGSLAKSKDVPFSITIDTKI